MISLCYKRAVSLLNTLDEARGISKVDQWESLQASNDASWKCEKLARCDSIALDTRTLSFDRTKLRIGFESVSHIGTCEVQTCLGPEVEKTRQNGIRDGPQGTNHLFQTYKKNWAWSLTSRVRCCAIRYLSSNIYGWQLPYWVLWPFTRRIAQVAALDTTRDLTTVHFVSNTSESSSCMMGLCSRIYQEKPACNVENFPACQDLL